MDIEQTRLEKDTKAHNEFVEGKIMPTAVRATFLEEAAQNTPFVDQRIALLDEASRLWNEANVQSEISHDNNQRIFRMAETEEQIKPKNYWPTAGKIALAGLGAAGLILGAGIMGADNVHAQDLTLSPEAITTIVAPDAVTAQIGYLKLGQGREGFVNPTGTFALEFPAGVTLSASKDINWVLDVAARDYFPENITGAAPEGFTTTLLPSKDLGLATIFNGIAGYPTDSTSVAMLLNQYPQLVMKGCHPHMDNSRLAKFTCTEKTEGITSENGYVLLPFSLGKTNLRINPKNISPEILKAIDELKKVEGKPELSWLERKAIGLPYKEPKFSLRNIKNSGVRLNIFYGNDWEDVKVAVEDEMGTPIVNDSENFLNTTDFGLQLEPRMTIKDKWAIHALLNLAYGHKQGNVTGENLDHLDTWALETGPGFSYNSDIGLWLAEAGYAGQWANMKVSGSADVSEDNPEKGWFGRVMWVDQSDLDAMISAAYKRTSGDSETTVAVPGMPSMDSEADTETEMYKLTGKVMPFDLGRAGKIGLLVELEKTKRTEGDFQTDVNALRGEVHYQTPLDQLTVVAGGETRSVDNHDPSVDVRDAKKLYLGVELELGSSEYR